MSYKPLYNTIYALSKDNNFSKHEQLVLGVLQAIDENKLKKGDKLPSINEAVAELGFARKTIVKAYEDLKDRGLVESKKLKGYYIASEETQQQLKVALILYAFHTFQEDFYNSFRSTLGPNVQLDVFFHHNNETLFDTILSNIDKKYGMYVIAPTQSTRVAEKLKQIPPEKLLIIDRYINLGPAYSYVTQEFEETTFNMLLKLQDQIKQYKKAVLFFRNDSDYPEGIKCGFSKFVKSQNIPAEIFPSYVEGSIQKDHFYIFISDNNLYQMIKDCLTNGYQIGKDIGIISHNDNIVKEILAGGITTISVDFKKMGVLAGKFVQEKKTLQMTLDSTLLNRNSL
ncbi:MAG: GntR family transcriptional regulator [Bacteroidia bacterium]|nr:GntR family transcriptional regulator [Bacteroidia bacterium]